MPKRPWWLPKLESLDLISLTLVAAAVGWILGGLTR